ncbi:hypothetical protein [Vagococcus fluvialis]|uniref:Uncharacterized protein n=1 Tax=Vagococcus fluvialis TaxID=2738 RepID=A0A7X6DAU4_9ENTE|nr:hypothetical protein [Vagococcus fluvialis]NKC68970.1 hypothetical protein [Vagococcus fluvialis]
MNYGYDTFLDVNFIRGLINNDIFMEMPIESQALFFHLIFNTDKEGFYPTANTIVRALGIGSENLDILEKNSFIEKNDNGFYFDPFSDEEII